MTIEGGTDVVIVGAGPAGSATALRLARCGHRVTLLDRAAFPRDKPCSEYMSPETVRHLAALDVLDPLEAAGGALLDGTCVAGPLGSALTGRFARAGGTPFRPTGLGLSRRILDAALVERARAEGVTVIEQARVHDLAVHDGAVSGVHATDSSGREVTFTARVVVGADGLGSVVARRAGLRTHGRVRRVAFVAHMSGIRNVTPTTELHVAAGYYIGINALGNGIANVALVTDAKAARTARGDATAFFWSMLRRDDALAARFVNARIERDVLVTGPFDARTRRSTADGLLLVGDAADFFDPFTGEGICSALRGAELAASAISDALTHSGSVRDRDLAPYRAARRKAFLGKWLVERLVGYGMFAPALFDRSIARLERRGMAHTLIGVTGHFVSPWRVLNPLFLAKMIV